MPASAASVSTLVVSWKLAAEMKLRAVLEGGEEVGDGQHPRVDQVLVRRQQGAEKPSFYKVNF